MIKINKKDYFGRDLFIGSVVYVPYYVYTEKCNNFFIILEEMKSGNIRTFDYFINNSKGYYYNGFTSKPLVIHPTYFSWYHPTIYSEFNKYFNNMNTQYMNKPTIKSITDLINSSSLQDYLLFKEEQEKYYESILNKCVNNCIC